MNKSLKSILLVFLFTLSCIPFLNAQEKVFPREGEGIYALLRRHNLTDSDYEEFVRLNKKKLGKDNTLLKGVAYLLPEKTASSNKPENKPDNSPKKRKEPLFGPKYEEYEIKDNILKGACFFLSSGHGGPDSGTTATVNGRKLHEDEYAYDFTLRLARNLLEHGATVHIIIQDPKDGIRDEEYLNNSKRETCMGAKIPRDPKLRLQQRVKKINQLSRKAKESYQRAIFIHLDSQEDRQIDVYFFHSDSKDSKQLALTLKNTFETKYAEKQPGRGYRGTAGYHPSFRPYVLFQSRPVGVFCEVGNIKNERDQKRFMQPSNRQAVANWFLAALIEDYRSHKGN
ncbi:MAG: N-acetylmuramoyl-L-alanine amidase [Dysgonamonadaceae bacterium]|jgi:N-acetylmuramoyl-L-alanine amidase|nr:N-acetylmuramoyl-L-alanine amidase [Dysgonamonadaceae bacterium]